VATYSLRVREFFAWFWEQVIDAKVDESKGITVRIQIAE
jgi:hypothetical protein